LIFRHLLSVLLFLPLAGGLLLLAIPSSRINMMRWWANIVAAATLVASLFLLANFRTDLAGFQMVERHDWIPTIGAQFLLGIDGISLLLVLLTTLISFLAVWCSWNSALDRPKLYYAMLLC
jgi:NADH-quinone oxidoreductase subunit M